eukprot:1198675-Lingulodinium_polyedra.AAC.1
MVDDGTQLIESNDYPPELFTSDLVPGDVGHVARLAVFSPTLLGSLAARSVDDFLLARALNCTFQL